MLTRSKVSLVALLISVGAACNSGRYSTAGFRLPPDGDADRGKQAFVKLGCPSCHRVAGVELPTPAVQPAVRVSLGGQVDQKLSDAYLVTAMIDPSYRRQAYPADPMASRGMSHMPNFADTMTVRQMVDVVAFLQANTSVRMPPVNYGLR